MQTPSVAWSEAAQGGRLDLTGYVLTFDDEFDTLSLNNGHNGGTWYSGVHADFGDATLPRGATAADPFSVQDGILTIRMKQVNGRWQGGLLQTVDAANAGFAQAYGYFEMRAAFSPGAGSWEGFWLLSPNLASDPAQARVEVDTIEAYGSDPAGYHTSLHYRPNIDTPGVTGHIWKSDYERLKHTMFDGAFHTYGTMITDQWIVTYLDGNEIARVAASEQTRAKFYMLLDLAMADQTQADPTKTYTMQVDYVRAYQNPALMAQYAALPGPTGTLTGDDGANVLSGTRGADVLTGGKGDDTYYVNDKGDRIVEHLGGGTDTIIASVTTKIATNVENLTMIGTAPLSALGNGAPNVITGNGADNVLDGRGGADTLIGGYGNDTYYIDNTGDKLVELAGQGHDLAYSSVSYALAGTSVEDLTLTGAADIDATGNADANVLTGNAGANVLDGGGGADILAGGKGDDTYYVDNADDKVIENPGEGADTVVATVSWSLAGTNVETLRLSGSAAVRAYGGDGGDQLFGNDADNRIDGGAGADTMAGGKGNDTYVVDSAGDQVIELGNEGNDIVYSAVSFAAGSQSIEAIRLTGSAAIDATGGAGNDTLTGNAGANVLAGGDGDDVICGEYGNDTYVGGAGHDSFALWGTPTSANRKTIADFAAADDAIRLVGGDYAALNDGTGHLKAGTLGFGSAATSPDMHFIYNQATGVLLWDVDGSGALPACVAMLLPNHAALGEANFTF